MKIYTKTGDEGTTSLFGGTRVSKAHHRIDTYGTIDELNSHIGLLRDQPVNTERKDILTEIQENLFVIGSILATEPGKADGRIPKLRNEAVEMLETEMDKMDEALPPMRNFVLPGGHQSVSFCHVARCVCRRAERLVVLLADHEPVQDLVLIYMNRLSDYLFVLARKMTQELNAEEVPWKPKS